VLADLVEWLWAEEAAVGAVCIRAAQCIVCKAQKALPVSAPLVHDSPRPHAPAWPAARPSHWRQAAVQRPGSCGSTRYSLHVSVQGRGGPQAKQSQDQQAAWTRGRTVATGRARDELALSRAACVAGEAGVALLIVGGAWPRQTCERNRRPRAQAPCETLSVRTQLAISAVDLDAVVATQSVGPDRKAATLRVN
jgi:hypothetical protein